MEQRQKHALALLRADAVAGFCWIIRGLVLLACLILLYVKIDMKEILRKGREIVANVPRIWNGNKSLLLLVSMMMLAFFLVLLITGIVAYRKGNKIIPYLDKDHREPVVALRRFNLVMYIFLFCVILALLVHASINVRTTMKEMATRGEVV